MIHWFELALNGGDIFAAILLTPELLRTKRERVAERFVTNVSAWATVGLWAAPVVGMVFALFSSDMASHVKVYVSTKNFAALRQYSNALMSLTVIYLFIICTSFMNQYLTWAEARKKENIFLVPGLVIFIVIRIISITGAFGLLFGED